jgi:aminopeptidase N
VQAWIAPLPDRRVVLVSLPEDGAGAALAALSRRLPHMARHAWLAFDGDRIAGRGNWPVRSPAVEVSR